MEIVKVLSRLLSVGLRNTVDKFKMKNAGAFIVISAILWSVLLGARAIGDYPGIGEQVLNIAGWIQIIAAAAMNILGAHTPEPEKTEKA